MVSLVTAAALLAAPSLASGFTSSSAPSPTRSSATIRLGAAATKSTESFQRSLLEAQLLANGRSINDDAVETTAVNGDEVPNVVSTDNIAIQNSILRIAASTDRGQYAKPAQKEHVKQLVSDLESNAPKHEEESSSSATTVPPYLSGTWELLYSNTQLFKSSPFFLAGRSTCKTPEQAQQFNWFCDMHRKALAISTIGVVRQVVTRDGKLINEFSVKVGAVPFLSDFMSPLSYSGGLPFTIDGAIVSTADISTPTSSNEWELWMDTVEIKGSNIPMLRTLLDSENVKLKSRDLSKLLEESVNSYETPKPVLRTTYADDTMRIARDEDDNIYVYGRVSDSEEPTDFSGVLPDLGIASLLEGFNDAITKVYL